VNVLGLVVALMLASSAAHAESFGVGPNGLWVNPYPQPYTYQYAPYPGAYPHDWRSPDWWRWHHHHEERHEEHRR
jgi:hypothetical protein